MADNLFGSDALGWDNETGQPGAVIFQNAVQVWSVMQRRPTSVAEAALAFNCDAAMIIEAVEQHYWMLLEGPRDDLSKLIIEHDGE